MHRIIRFFDKLEDKVRIFLSHQPILYAIIGGIGVVLFWKGVWETAEIFPALHGPASLLLGSGILLMSGLLVSVFIGDSILLSGFRREKKLTEKTVEEVESEQDTLDAVVDELVEIKNQLDTLKAHNAKEKRHWY